MRKHIVGWILVLLLVSCSNPKPQTVAERGFLIFGSLVDGRGVPIAGQEIYLVQAKDGELELSGRLVDGVATITNPTATTDADGRLTIKVPEQSCQEGGDLTIATFGWRDVMMPWGPARREHSLVGLSRDGKPLRLRLATRPTGKLDLGELALEGATPAVPWRLP